MRKLITILFLCSKVFATNYYVANSGNDSNDGLTVSTPFATGSQALAVAVKKDSILFNKGDSWNASFLITTDSLYIGSYGSGALPIITGYQDVSVTSLGGNLYSGTFSNAVKKLNNVTVNGNLTYKARTPNTGFISTGHTIDNMHYRISHDGSSYVGSEITMRENEWTCETRKIVSQASGVTYDTLTFDKSISYTNGVNYFFQNNASYIDVDNEYSIDSSSKLLTVRSTTVPVVKGSSLDTLFTIQAKGVVIDGLKISGANQIAFYVTSHRYDTIKNCTFTGNAVNAYVVYTNGFGFVNNILDSSLAAGFISGTDTSTYISNNSFNHSGVWLGMAGDFLPSILTYLCIYKDNAGNNAQIQYNTVKNSAYHGIRFGGQYANCYRNFVDSFCTKLSDGGGIYMFVGTDPATTNLGSVISENIVTHLAFDVNSGSYNLTNQEGNLIYLDNGTYNVTVDANTIAYSNSAFFTADIGFHELNNTITNNKCFDSLATNIYVTIEGNNKGMRVTGNTLFNKTAANLLFSGVKDSTENVDNNYYFNINANKLFTQNSTSYSFSAWKAYYPAYNINSSNTLPANIVSQSPIIVYNQTLNDSTFSINGVYTDVEGHVYANTIKLKSFESKILWPSTLTYSKYSYTKTFLIKNK